VAGWKGDKFVYVTNGEFFSQRIGETIDSVANKMPVVSSVQQLRSSCKSLFALPDEVSMTKVEKFSDLLKEKGDLHWWSNSEELLKTSGQTGMINLGTFQNVFKGVLSTATVNFNDGKIEMRQKMYAGEQLSPIFKKYGGGEVNEDMLKRIPSKNIAAVMSFHYQPEGIREILKVLGVDGIVNMGLSQAGITMDDFIKANKGDLLFSVSDVVIKQDTFKSQQGKGMSISPDAHYLFAVSIADKTAFNKLMDVGRKLGPQMSGSNFSNAINDKYLAIGNDQQFVSGFIHDNNNTFDFTSKFNDHPIGVYVDIHKILTGLPSNMGDDSTANKIIDESEKMWENLYSTGGEFKDGGVVMTSEINLVDKNTNSLKQLNHYFDLIYAEIRKKEAMSNKAEDIDNVMPPIIDSMKGQ
jgi:hypothetical protein